jgi:ribosomal protein L37AE/L43A
VSVSERTIRLSVVVPQARPERSEDGMSERAVPYYCPYCGGEDLRPHDEHHGTWECRECTRVFTLKLIGQRVVVSQ